MYCIAVGMLLIAEVRPDSSIIGISNTNVYSIACCMVAENADSASPMPTEAVVNSASARYSVKIEPWNGMPNQKSASNRMIVDCTRPMRIEGTALPIMISVGRRGVTSSWSNVPCSRSRATDSAREHQYLQHAERAR